MSDGAYRRFLIMDTWPLRRGQVWRLRVDARQRLGVSSYAPSRLLVLSVGDFDGDPPFVCENSVTSVVFLRSDGLIGGLYDHTVWWSEKTWYEFFER